MTQDNPKGFPHAKPRAKTHSWTAWQLFRYNDGAWHWGLEAINTKAVCEQITAALAEQGAIDALTLPPGESPLLASNGK